MHQAVVNYIENMKSSEIIGLQPLGINISSIADGGDRFSDRILRTPDIESLTSHC